MITSYLCYLRTLVDILVTECEKPVKLDMNLPRCWLFNFERVFSALIFAQFFPHSDVLF